MLYAILKFLHIAGVVLLIGNVTVTAFWKVFADRTKDARLVAHAQHAVIVADFLFTIPGIVLIIAGGYGMVYEAGLDALKSGWLVWGQIFFLMAGVVWLGILVPAQMRQSRAARTFKPGEDIPESYARDGRLWLIWGIIATVPLVAATYVMIWKG